MSRWYRFTAIIAFVVVALVAFRTCGVGSDLVNQPQEEPIEAELTLQTVTLEQPDEEGMLLWRLKAQAVNYKPDSQRAELRDLEGEFFQNGETIYTVTADEGEVQQNGEVLFLRGNLVAESPEDELTLEGERLKWQPKQDLLVMGNFKDDNFLEETTGTDEAATDEALTSGGGPNETNSAGNDGEQSVSDEQAEVDVESLLTPDSSSPQPFDPEAFIADLAQGEDEKKLSFARKEEAPVIGFTPRVEAIAQVVVVANQENRVDLAGGVLARSKETPWMTFESDVLAWFTQRELIEASRPIKVEQYANEDYQTVTDRLVGAEGQVQLDENIVLLDRSVQLDQFVQSLTVQSETALWDVDAQTVTLDKPVDIAQPERNITASASRANLDLDQEVIYLIGTVRAQGGENDSRLKADKVTWQTNTQDVEAEGNVSYQQAANPEVVLTGPKAVGNLEQGTVVITGDDSTQVITEIVPGEAL